MSKVCDATVTIEIDGHVLRVSMEEARKLKNELIAFFDSNFKSDNKNPNLDNIFTSMTTK